MKKRVIAPLSLLFALVLSLSSLHADLDHRPVPAPVLHAASITPLSAIFALGGGQKHPIGVVIGADNELCSVRPRIDVVADNLQDALADVLKGTTYSAVQEGDVLDVFPRQKTQVEAFLLAQKLGAFAPAPAPMHIIGTLFDGWLGVALHPKLGFAFGGPSQTTDVPVEIKTGKDDTALQVLNTLVSKGGGGVWLMQPQTKHDPDKEDSALTPLVEVFSYADNADVITRLGCWR